MRLRKVIAFESMKSIGISKCFLNKIQDVDEYVENLVENVRLQSVPLANDGYGYSPDARKCPASF